PAERGGLAVGGGAPGINAALEMVGEYTVVVLANLDPPAAEDLAAAIRQQLMPGAAAGGHERRMIRAGAPGGPLGRPGRTLLPAAAVEVPMERSGQLPVVMVKVNGQGPFRFAIDTGGAGAARIDSALAARLGLRTVGEVHAGDPSGLHPVTMAVVAVDSIEIG